MATGESNKFVHTYTLPYIKSITPICAPEKTPAVTVTTRHALY